MEYNIDFLKARKLCGLISIILVMVGVISLLLYPLLFHRPILNMGIDFSPGTQLRFSFASEVPTSEVRNALGKVEIPGVDLTRSTIQDFRDLPRVKTITIKTTGDEGKDKKIADKVVTALEENFPGAEVISREFVGGQVSEELKRKGWQAVLFALVVILVYVAWRFKLRYAVGGVVALIHDVLIAVGVFSIFRVEVNLPVIAAFLTIVGYSLNDTIVIFDRVRENMGTRKRRIPYYEVINKSINQSLSRTIQTSLTTFIPVIILFIFGGSVLRAFSLALLIGVIVGTYSSIYVASPIVYYWSLKAEAR